MSVPDQWTPVVGPNLVQASAGTGKTTWMVRTAVRLLLQDIGVPALVRPDRLLAVTFTRAATAELKERIREALRQVQRVRDGGAPREHEEWIRAMLDNGGVGMSERLDGALASMDRLAVTTIHGFCKGVLEEFALECGVPVGLRFIEQDHQYRSEAVADEWRSLTWESDRVSRFVMSERMSGDPKRRTRWSPDDFARAARVVRQGIGAKRPERVDRRAVLETLHSAVRDAAAVWNEQRLRAFHSRVTWNKDGNTLDDVDALCVAISELRAGADPVIEDVARWARTRVAKVASQRPKANKALLDGELFLDACEEVHKAHVSASSALWQDAVLSVAERIERAMERDRVAGFDEMIGFLQRAISDERSGDHMRQVLADRYDAVLVDEFQDTDWAQWNIFSSTFGIRPLVLVGDPKQSIYGFRGADITAYREAQQAALTNGTDRVFSLDTNYRSDKSLVEATEILFTRAAQPFGVDKTILDFETVRAARSAPSLIDPLRRPMVLVDFGQDGAEEQERKTADFVAAEIARLLRDPSVTYHGPTEKEPRPLRPKDIAILVSANRQAEPLLEALRKRRIAAVSGTTGDITDSVTWQDVFVVVAAIDDPSNPRVVRRALASSLGGWSARELAALEQDGTAWRELLERLAEARRDWTSHGVLTALMRLINDWKARETLASYPDGERRLTDFRHVVSLLQDAERKGHRNPALLRSWARSFAAEIDRDAEYRQQHLESDEDAVTISTVHAAKGLEWPIVFCGYLWKSRLSQTASPRLARFADGRREIVFSDQPVTGEIPGDSVLSESLRLAYVALTRARSRTYVVWAKSKGANNGAIHHLLDGVGGSPPTKLANDHSDLIATISGDDAAKFEVPDGDYGDTSSSGTTARATAVSAQQRRSWTVSSYTRFTKGLKVSPEPIELSSIDDAEAAIDDATSTNQLPGGAHTGNALHELFEQLDFTTIGDSATLNAAIDGALTRYALPAAGADAVRRMVTATLSAPIPGASRPLAAVPIDRTLREWRFDLSMERVSAARLAEIFREHGEAWLANSYAPMLMYVARSEIDGFLTGIVDLVAEMDGRWWIVDWKSNTLGPRASSYDEPSCRRTMLHEHYVLQYHIYVVALHRYLRSRLGTSYDYDRDFGGVGYAFLRGLAMGTPSWFTDRPSPALVEALDAAIGGYSR